MENFAAFKNDLSVRLRLIAALVQRGDLEPLKVVAEIDHNPTVGVVDINCCLRLRQEDAKDEIDLNTWEPSEEDYVVDVLTRREWRQRRRAQRLQRSMNVLLFFITLNAAIVIAHLKGLF